MIEKMSPGEDAGRSPPASDPVSTVPEEFGGSSSAADRFAVEPSLGGIEVHPSKDPFTAGVNCGSAVRTVDGEPEGDGHGVGCGRGGGERRPEDAATAVAVPASRGTVVVHEGESTRITFLPDYAPPSGGRSTAAAVKSLVGPNPATENVIRLNNEFNVLSRYLADCDSARKALGRETAPDRTAAPTLYLEWVEGMPLREWVEAANRRATKDDHNEGGDMEQKNKNLLANVKLMQAVAAALSDVNEAGVVHNDISSNNMIVRDGADGEGVFVKLIDFGFATHRHALETDDVGETVNDDLYSLGLVFCEILIDRPIPDAVRDGVDTIMASFFRDYYLPRSLLSLLSDLLEFQSSLDINPYRSIQEVVEDLDQMIEDPARFLFDPKTADEIAQMDKLAFIPDKLYGKFEEFSDALMGAYKRNLASPSMQDVLLGKTRRHVSVSAEGHGLKSSLSRRFDSGCHFPEIVLISGPSGSGKSHLAHRIQSPLMKEGRVGGLFARGKYEKLRMHQPYWALTNAFNGLCDRILRWDEADLSRVRDRILEAVGPEGRVLMSLIPSLREIIGEPEGDLASLGTIEAQNRLKFVLRMFVRAISQQDHPVALVLEDIQWADAASLDIIHTLVADPELRFFLFVGCYRPRQDLEAADEIATKRASLSGDFNTTSERSLTTANTGRSSKLLQLSEFAAFIAQMEDLEEEDKLRITQIEVGSLDRESMNSLISDALRMPKRLTRSLTDKLYPKTQGNIYFTKECLKFLSEDSVLTFEKDLLRWRWDTIRLKNHSIADSMVDLLEGRIKKLPTEAQNTLKLAACIGLRFDRTTLEQASRDVVDKAGALFTSAVGRYLDLLESEGFIESENQSYYFFTHARIHQAASMLLHKRERNRVYSQIGEIMWENTPEGEKKDILFAAVDHMNKGKLLLKDVSKRTQLASLNVRAGEESIAKSAFIPALNYLRTARKLLPANHWSDHYDLSLRLFNALVEAEQCTSRYVEMDSHLEQVFSHAQSFPHKLKANKILIRAYGAQKQLQKAIDTGLKVLQQLGQPFPMSTPSKVEIRVDYLKTKAALRGKTDVVLKNRDEMEDMTILDVVQIISSLVRYAYLSREELVPLLVFRMIRLTVRYGLSKVTAFAFAMYGMILCGMGDYKDGNRFADLAFYFLQRFSSKEWVARVNGACYFFVRHWREPLSLGLEPLLQSHRVGQEAGDIEYAFVNAHWYCCHAFQSGQSLVDLEEKAGEFCFNMEQHHQTTVLLTTLPVWQTVLNLMGQSPDPLRLTGNAMDEDEVLDEAAAAGSHNSVYITYFFRMVLSYLFGRYKVASEMSERTHDIDQVIMASFFVIDHAFYSGLTACAMSLTERSRKWTRAAVNAKKKLKKQAKNSPGNCLQKYLLLKAELAALKGKRAAANKYYDEAIEAAVKNGFLQDEAIANERASLFLKNCGDMAAASRYRSSSHSCYMKWGAFGKADLLHGSEQGPSLYI